MNSNPYRQQCVRLADELDEAMSKVERLRERLGDRDQDCAIMRAEINSLRIMRIIIVPDLKAEIERLREIVATDTAFSKLESEIERLRTELADAEDEIQVLRETVQELTDEA